MAPKKAMAPFQSVFKLDIKPSQNGEAAAPRAFAPRKAHRKSRGGCSSCKKKRIKCDELRPTCSKCAKSCSDCVYLDSPRHLRSPSPTDAVHTPSSKMYSMAMDLVETDLSSLLFQGFDCPIMDDAEMSNAHLLQHFQAVASLTLGSTEVKNLMHHFVASTAWSQPFLMHMVLAVSCAHQKRLGFQDPFDFNRGLTEATHWERSLQLYRQHLAKLQSGREPDSWDSAVATTFLQIMYTFALDDDVPQDSLMTSEDVSSQLLDPLMAIGGFRSLFFVYRGLDPDSKWFSVLVGTDDARNTYSRAEVGISGLPRAFVELCGLDEFSDSTNNPYHRIVRLLTPILRLKPDPENFATLFAFFGRVWSDLKPLILRKDPRGLLLLAYWLALLRQLDQWWLRNRVKTECLAIVAYLSTLPDLKIKALLPFPAAFRADASFMWELLEFVIEDTVESSPESSYSGLSDDDAHWKHARAICEVTSSEHECWDT